jgi:chromosomal replication initiation ATPase DnaA
MSDLETFLLEPANRAAAMAAQAVADATGLPFAPLLVQGPPGSGKTDLLEAISARLRARHPGVRLEQLGADALAERYRTALVLGKGDACRATLVAAELLLLDDLERLARHRDCQGLVADLLDARRAAGRETVVATGRPVTDLDGLDARLARRLTEGTTVHLALPGAPARREILRRRMAGGSHTLSSDVIEALSEAPFPSMRDYTGALSRLVAFQQASAAPLTAADAMALIGAPSSPPLPAVAEAPVEPSVAARESPEPKEETAHDEFGAFLSEVEAGVSEQVDRWRRRVGEAVLRWGAEGFRTRRLEALLGDEVPGDPEPVLSGFDADVRSLRALAAEIETLAPDLAGAEVFRDPDQLGSARELVEQARDRGVPLSTPLPQYRLDELAEGPACRSAMDAVRDLLAAAPRTTQPVVIVGGPGLGKTHLLHGTGNALAALGVGPLACLNAQAFAAELTSLRTAEELSAWRVRYRWVGALLLDDLHLLAQESRAQEELLRLTTDLAEGQRPLIFTSAVALESLTGLDPRLLTRLQGGRVVPLRPPDREMKLAMTKRLLAGTPAAHDAGLADYFAGRPAESVRALQTAVQKLLDESAAQRVSPSPALAREVLDLDGLEPRPARRGGPPRASGILSPGLGLVKSREKMIDEWPSVADQLIAEFK